MQVKTFKKGIRVPHNKRTDGSPLVECPAPAAVYIPVAQHIGKPAVPVVSVGDAVKAGTLIAAADGAVSSNIFSSVSGKVTAIERRKTPTGACLHIVIENDGKYEEQKLSPLTDRSRDAILARIFEAGIVGMGGAGFPTRVKFAPTAPIDTLIINAAECEPYITCDYRLLVEHTSKVVCGARLLASVLGLKSFIVGIEDNKPDAVAALQRLSEKGEGFDIAVLKSKYPQGAEKQLIFAVTGRKVPIGALPADVGVVVGNVHTAYSVFDAVENDTPLYRRALTVCGGGIVDAKNLWVRTGTRYSDLDAFCGGATEDCVKIISGGPMMGFAIEGEDYSVTKTTGAILYLSAAEANVLQPRACINCAKCARACPMNLMPMYIDAYALRGDYASSEKYGATSCIECGCCAYSCPSKRPIVQSVRLAKRKIREAKR